MKRTIYIKEVTDDGMEVISDSASDEVLKGIMREGMGENYNREDRARIRVFIVKSGDTIDVKGEISLDTHPACSRCLKGFAKGTLLPIHVVLAPMYKGRREEERVKSEEPILVKDDIEFSYLEGDSFDLGEIIRENLVLGQPMVYLCNENCKGLCPRCGKDLNKGKCKCGQEAHSSPFEVLKNYKAAKKKKR